MIAMGTTWRRRNQRSMRIYTFALVIGNVALATASPTLSQSIKSKSNDKIAPKPHILMILIDDWGWADVGFHAKDPVGGIAPDRDLVNITSLATPTIDSMVGEGIQLSRHYVFKFCSPSRCSLQSGRNPIHVNVMNLDPININQNDPVSGFSGIPRNMTGMASMLKRAGYVTYFSGKWDAGMATYDHTPRGRGYDASLNYFHHANDYYTFETGSCSNGSASTGVVDLWEGVLGGGEGPAARLIPSTKPNCTEEMQGPECVYEDFLFTQHVLDNIAHHDTTSPLFQCWCPHIVHAPLEVPTSYLSKFDFMNGRALGNQEWWRQLYMSMVSYVDTSIAAVQRALKKKAMWEDTLVVLSADNGGPIYWSGVGGANNWPLRGGKGSNWEGGVRVNAFVSGGFVPLPMRGRKLDGLAALWDWYGTFAALAGVDPTDTRAAAAGLPAIDSVNLWPWLSGRVATSPRTRIALGGCANPRDTFCSASATTVQGLIVYDGTKLWKLLTGLVWQDGFTGPDYPNNTIVVDYNKFYGNCSNGCLFELTSDPTEHKDVSVTEKARVKSMLTELAAVDVFSPDRGSAATVAACKSAKIFGGERSSSYVWGPFVL